MLTFSSAVNVEYAFVVDDEAPIVSQRCCRVAFKVRSKGQGLKLPSSREGFGNRPARVYPVSLRSTSLFFIKAWQIISSQRGQELVVSLDEHRSFIQSNRMTERDIYRHDVDFAALALQSPAFNKLYSTFEPAFSVLRLTLWQSEDKWPARFQ